MPIRAIARWLGVGRGTVLRALAADGPPRYQRPSKGSAVDAVEPQIRLLLKDFPQMPATVIAERIGWAELGISPDQLAGLHRRFEVVPGTQAQVDWG